MSKLLALALGGVSLLVLSSASHAATVDLSPVINEAIADVVVPVLIAVAPAVAALLVMPLRRFLDQRASSDVALRVNDLLDKAIAFAATEAKHWVTDEDFHATVDSGITNIAVSYAMGHAPGLLKQAGAKAAAWSGAAAKAQADQLLREKIVARLSSHPDVAAVKALAPPAPVAKPLILVAA